MSPSSSPGSGHRRFDSNSDPFEVMAHPVRRFLVEQLASSEAPAMALAELVQHQFGFGWPAVSRHLHILHDAGFVKVRREWSSRLYRLDVDGLRRLNDRMRALWDRWSSRQGDGYDAMFVPPEDAWPTSRARKPPMTADESIDQIMRDLGFDPETGELVGRRTVDDRDGGPTVGTTGREE